MVVACSGHHECVAKLLEHDGSAEHLNKANADGKTALQLATERMEETAPYKLSERYKMCVDALQAAAN